MSWQADAACGDADPTLFFPTDEGTPEERKARQDQALSFCRQCSVRARCFEDAGPYGIWGGSTARQRSRARAEQAKQDTPPPPKPPRLPATTNERCGSMTGYRWHRSHNQEACTPCKKAKAADSRDERAGRPSRQQPATPTPVRVVTHQEVVAA